MSPYFDGLLVNLQLQFLSNIRCNKPILRSRSLKGSHGYPTVKLRLGLPCFELRRIQLCNLFCDLVCQADLMVQHHTSRGQTNDFEDSAALLLSRVAALER